EPRGDDDASSGSGAGARAVHVARSIGSTGASSPDQCRLTPRSLQPTAAGPAVFDGVGKFAVLSLRRGVALRRLWPREIVRRACMDIDDFLGPEMKTVD